MSALQGCGQPRAAPRRRQLKRGDCGATVAKSSAPTSVRRLIWLLLEEEYREPLSLVVLLSLWLLQVEGALLLPLLFLLLLAKLSKLLIKQGPKRMLIQKKYTSHAFLFLIIDFFPSRLCCCKSSHSSHALIAVDLFAPRKSRK